ncbi:MAG TPA: PsiF family protein [Steroidobacteraceae bacterium]|nr:PsiF family protein [Steroidobacteraceae bacterium]
MKRSTWLMAIGAALALLAGQSAVAQSSTTAAPSTHLNSQQEMMKSCNAEATGKGLKGDERKTFMKSCLSSKGMSEADINKQQQKMKTCNADATSKGLKGDDRKAFMKTCLSGS